MQGGMRPSGPRPQTFSTMRPTSQVPRMMSTQRVRKSPVKDSDGTANKAQLRYCCSVFSVWVLKSLPICVPCSWSDHGPSPRQRSCCSRRSCASSSPVQVHCRRPQYPAAHVCSAASHHAAGKRVNFCWVLPFGCTYKMSDGSLCPRLPSACRPCPGTGASDCLHAGCSSTTGTEADAG